MPQTLMNRLLAKTDLAGKVGTCKITFHRKHNGVQYSVGQGPFDPPEELLSKRRNREIKEFQYKPFKSDEMKTVYMRNLTEGEAERILPKEVLEGAFTISAVSLKYGGIISGHFYGKEDEEKKWCKTRWGGLVV